MAGQRKNNDLFWRALKSFVCRSADFFYAVLPKKFALKFYCYLTYILRTVAWRLACKYYGSGVVKYRGGVDKYVLSHIQSGDRVLDVGCAEGYLSVKIAAKARTVVGVDVDKNYLDNIDKDIKALKNASFINGDVLNMDFKERFDVAVLVHAIEHMEKSRDILKKLSTIAHKILVETPTEECDWLAEIMEEMGIEDIGDDKHVRLYNDKSLRDELEASGWADVATSWGPGVVRAVAFSRTIKV